MKDFVKASFFKSLLVILLAILIVVVIAFISQNTTAQSASQESDMFMHYQELFDFSQSEQKGLLFYVNGQTIVGAVTQVINNEAVEVFNEEYQRLVIRIDHINAVGHQW